MFLAAGVVENAFTVGFLLFLTNFAQASPDVMIDASIAGKREKTMAQRERKARLDARLRQARARNSELR